MKVKTTKICDLKGCDVVFKLFKTTDKFCCPDHYFQDQKSKPKKPLKPFKYKKQKPIKQYSNKRAAQIRVYNKNRLPFLKLPENKHCKAAKVIFNEAILVTEVHHIAGRKGWLLNYIPLWLAVCRKSHDWIHANPKAAEELGFLIRPTTINKSKV